MIWAGFYSVLRSMGLDPGAEFKVAMDEAERQGAKLVFGDRDQDVTAQKMAQHFGLAVRKFFIV